jgi:hypothetical protein
LLTYPSTQGSFVNRMMAMRKNIYYNREDWWRWTHIYSSYDRSNFSSLVNSLNTYALWKDELKFTQTEKRSLRKNSPVPQVSTRKKNTPNLWSYGRKIAACTPHPLLPYKWCYFSNRKIRKF